MTRSPVFAFWTICLSLPLTALVIGVGATGYWTVVHRVEVEGDPINVYDSELGFVPSPNASTKRTDYRPDGTQLVSYHLYTDQRGARVGKPGIVSPQHIDIMTIGCSVAWGHGVENEDTFAAKVGARLRLTESNFAMGSYGTVQSLQMLRRNASLAPRLVIYEFITDHLRRNVSPCTPSYYPFCMDTSYVAWGADGRPRIKSPRSNGVRRTKLQVVAETAGLDPVTWFLHGLDVDYGRILLRISEEGAKDTNLKDTAFRFLLEQMDRTVKDIGAKMLVVYVPISYDLPPATLLQAVSELSLPFLDLTRGFRQNTTDPLEPPAYIPNDGHPSVTGHQIIADNIVNFVLREGLLR